MQEENLQSFLIAYIETFYASQTLSWRHDNGFMTPLII